MIVGSSFLIYWILAVEVSVIQVPLEKETEMQVSSHLSK